MQLLETNEGKFLTQAKNASEKETEAQEKMVLAGENCRLKTVNQRIERVMAIHVDESNTLSPMPSLPCVYKPPTPP